ncbi:MAG: glutamyl-tRNA reductase [Opitutales bacterium]
MKEAIKQLYLVGSSHRTAPLHVREQLAVPEDLADRLAENLHSMEGLDEWMLLNTCNRVELYLYGDRPNLPKEVATVITDLHGIDPTFFWNHAYQQVDEDGVTHAFEVASGLDSQMIGETEILGQMKAAYARAQQTRSVGPVLNRVFQKSFQAAKWARTHTGVGRGQISIGNIAAELAERICGDLSSVRILLAGSGEAGEKTAQALVSRGARTVTVTSRTAENALALASRLDATAMDFETFERSIQLFDVVIGSTAAPGSILTRKAVRGAMRQRRTVPLFLIDLALPRDFEPDCGKLPNVYLYNLDDLSAVANENLKSREAEVEACRKALHERATRVWHELTGRAKPTAKGTPQATDQKTPQAVSN